MKLACVANSSDQGCVMGGEKWQCWPVCGAKQSIISVSVRGWGEGSKCGSSQGGGRAAENDGFKFLVMSHVEAGMFF